MKHEPLFRVLTEIIEGICQDHLAETRIFEENLDGVDTLTVLPHMADYPKLIGRNGAQANAFNYLVQRAARRLESRLAFSIRESFIGDREPMEPFSYNPTFDLEAFAKLLDRLTDAVTGEDLDFTVSLKDAMVIARYPCERNHPHETMGGALTSVLRPYVFRLGRSLYIKPQFPILDARYETKNEIQPDRAATAES